MTSILTTAAAYAALVKAQNLQKQKTDADGAGASSPAEGGDKSVSNPAAPPPAGSELEQAMFAALGAGEPDLSSLASFMASSQVQAEGGLGPQVDADLSVESAKLKALQVQQQLGVQSLSIANQSSQSILKLFQ